MAYEKNTWARGDVVTSAKLNHMEDGIAAGGGVMVVELQEDGATLDKTWQEIFDACMSGGCIIHQAVTVPTGTVNNYHLVEILISGPSLDGSSLVYSVTAADSTYTCDSPNDYPSGDSGDEPIG